MQDMIYAKYGVLDVEDDGMIKLADEQMLGYEANRLMPCVNWSPTEWGWYYEKFHIDIDATERPPSWVDCVFLKTANNLIDEVFPSA